MLAISAGSVLTDQLLRRRIEALPAPLIGQTLKIGEGLTAPLAGIPPQACCRSLSACWLKLRW
jgi:hypothetical protein